MGVWIILLVNKCEGCSVEFGLYEGYELGFGEFIVLFVEYGEGMGDFYCELMDYFLVLSIECEGVSDD